MPIIPLYETIDLELFINGQNDNLHTSIESLTVEYEVNRIPYAKINLVAGNHFQNNAKAKALAFAISDEIEIKIREDGEMKTLFKGLIEEIKKKMSASGFRVQLECKDIVSRLLTVQEIIPNETFQDRFDRLLSHHSISNTLEIASLGDEQISLVDNLSPWDFIISYLDTLGYLTTIKKGVFSAILSTDLGEVTTELQFGVNIFDLEYRRSSTVASVMIEYWDISDQENKREEVDTEVEGSEGIEVNDLGQTYLTPETINKIARGRAAKNRLSTFSGRVKTFGNLQANYGEYMSFIESGNDFEEQSLLITSEHHSIDENGWKTEYAFGLENSQSYVEFNAFVQSKNESRLGQMNSISGLQIGKVTNLEDDPVSQYRVQVQITSINDSGEGYWARLSSIQAGQNRGGWFVPDIGDEVVLGFFSDNPDSPVILGKLYSDNNIAPFDLNNDNFIQGIVTKEGSHLIFDDEKKSIEAKTAGGNIIVISDDESGIILEDQNGNKIQMDSSGITIESAKDLNLKANMSVTIEGVQNSFKASGIMEIQGSLIQLN
ncbi:hypothetical protein ESY86_00515 [Subsaximicrobium wynnwilliamsii]|uniref:Gp5/Type VI secretion system Vgr protein OB-fold domain-containing protein n=1 Tax=Subsaximicrobium wynnwilliamsii TaxID=291179 RepID=A0A5C6ZME1_9FLAO|nr:phage baseplate assembly protein V [Subsaximicrobium wynnwilliamsii]TXD85069.1 hypothetical protein ESY87_01685 [Subsaximicrobium wynnwilliamsii]TXD91112.1 hypothetical protein ESY86_00515 [Subsaximicrobium wynnwilliamsii]TXE04506.1 hypothetical protein ESY88_03165 [Subsaximicrobium wynnwilliamsii]